jgi:hypothetical protein
VEEEKEVDHNHFCAQQYLLELYNNRSKDELPQLLMSEDFPNYIGNDKVSELARVQYVQNHLNETTFNI